MKKPGIRIKYTYKEFTSPKKALDYLDEVIADLDQKIAECGLVGDAFNLKAAAAYNNCRSVAINDRIGVARDLVATMKKKRK